MPTTLSASPSTTIADWTAATFVVGFRSATRRSDDTADLRDWFPWTEATGTQPGQVQLGRCFVDGRAPNSQRTIAPCAHAAREHRDRERPRPGVLLSTVLRAHPTWSPGMADSTVTFRVDEELKAAFAEIAAAQERTAAQLLRALMRDAVQGWRESQEHDTWFRQEVEQGVGEADDPAIDRLPHDRVLSTWRQQRAELERRAAGRTA